ncbi:MAG: nitroreductase family deazaflavin-dependent oxidoreductase [Chloroflexota bacterium]|nr:nitroreductase family deazaflavin-dependent oxidoreductase [Chloroflexota bacterium]
MLFWLGRQDWFNWLGPRLFTPIDKWLYPRTHGAVVSAGPPVLPLLMLTTAGRVTGRHRAVPLLYMRHGDDLIVVGSNWARTRHPGWSANLLANARCSVTIGRFTQSALARLLPAEEADALWPILEAFCPAWRTYRDRSRRDLRVFALRPAPAGVRPT